MTLYCYLDWINRVLLVSIETSFRNTADAASPTDDFDLRVDN